MCFSEPQFKRQCDRLICKLVVFITYQYNVHTTRVTVFAVHIIIYFNTPFGDDKLCQCHDVRRYCFNGFKNRTIGVHLYN